MSGFLKNCWYLAAWADEIRPGVPFARTIAGEPVVFYHGETSVIALADRCPHRFAPLSLGRVHGDSIECAYHGLRFGADGRCNFNPHGSASRAVRTQSFPVVERHAAIWIWLGNPEIAEPANIPDLGFIDEVPERSRVFGMLPTKANYLLVVDNILDLTHADSLHPDTLGGGSITRVKPEVIEESDAVTCRWFIPGEPAPPVIDKYLDVPGSLVNALRETRMSVPGIGRLVGRFTPVSDPDGVGIQNITAHVMTPETDFSTHYFYCTTRNFDLGNDNLTKAIGEMTQQVFGGEDRPMIEAQQERMGANDFWSLNPKLVAVDHGSVAFRRLVERRIAIEADAGWDPVA